MNLHDPPARLALPAGEATARTVPRVRWARTRRLLLTPLRRLLYLVVRTQVTPVAVAEAPPAAPSPLCYVLQDRHLSSLLVLEEETRKRGMPSSLDPLGPGFPVAHAVFSVILNRNPLSTRTAEPSETLAQMTRALIGDQHLDVRLVPVTILWGRAPGTQDSLLKAIFADAWASVGPLRQLAIIALQGRQTRVNFGEPVSLRRLVDGETEAATAVRKVNRFLRFHFRRMRESAIGPDLSHRRNLIDAMIASKPLAAAIADEAERTRTTAAAAERRARRYAWEIASDFSYPVIRAAELVLRRLWRRLYDRVEVHHATEVTRLAPGRALVYLPNHRSHIDYLLLGYQVHAQGLAPPHIAAGANLDFPIVGPVLRRAGAFFLRRSFKGRPLYAEVFGEYLHVMLAKGFPIAYFVEGGRSRSGRMLPPKSGLLGMTLESYMRERRRPLYLLPVHFSYEKLIEGPTLVAELAGRPKQSESLGALVSAVASLRHEYGTAHVNFGAPLSVDEFLDREAPGWQGLDGEERRAAARRLTVALGREVTQRINAAVVINPIHLFAMAIVPSARHALDERGMLQQIDWLKTIASRLPLSPHAVLATDEPPTVIAQALRLGFAKRIAHPLGDVIAVPDDQVATLNYLRNNVLHAYALPALVAGVLIGTRETTLDRIAEFAASGLPFLRAELMLDASRDEALARSRRVVELLVAIGLARSGRDGSVRAADRYSTEHAGLELLARSLRHILRRNYLTFALLHRVGAGRLSRERLEELVRMLTQRLSLLFEFAPPDFFERATFASYIDNLLETELVREDAAGKLYLDEQTRSSVRNVERLLPADAVIAIRRVAMLHLPPA